MQSGWAIREKYLLDGRRQIFSFAIPGDFLGLHINFRRVAAYSIRALTDLELALVEPNRILEIYQHYPILASGLSWATAREYNMLGEHAVRLGWRSATERLCHLLLEMWRRLCVVDLSSETTENPLLEFPFSQQDVADTLGLSTVHVNRTFRALKEQEIIDYNNDFVRLNSVEKLSEIAEFDPTYLASFDMKPEAAKRTA